MLCSDCDGPALYFIQVWPICSALLHLSLFLINIRCYSTNRSIACLTLSYLQHWSNWFAREEHPVRRFGLVWLWSGHVLTWARSYFNVFFHFALRSASNPNCFTTRLIPVQRDPEGLLKANRNHKAIIFHLVAGQDSAVMLQHRWGLVNQGEESTNDTLIEKTPHFMNCYYQFELSPISTVKNRAVFSLCKFGK